MNALYLYQDPFNLQALCPACHSKKTPAEDALGSMTTTSNDASVLACQIERLGRVLRVLNPDSLLWLAIAMHRGELLRRRTTLQDLRFVLLTEPTSVIDL